MTIHINGCTVTCPAEQEQIYHDALADKWIGNYKVYVKDNDVYIDMEDDDNEADLETLEAILIEQNHKIYALAGKLQN